MSSRKPVVIAAQPGFRLWDSSALPDKESFSAFRDGLCSSLVMPWSPEPNQQEKFRARMAIRLVDEIPLGRFLCSPITTVRTERDITKSGMECFYAVFALSGNTGLGQGDCRTVAKRGDLLLFDSAKPAVWNTAGQYESLVLSIPKERFAKVKKAPDRLSNAYVSSRNLVSPLAQCFQHLSVGIASYSKEELKGLYDACVSLIPVAVGCYEHSADSSSSTSVPATSLHEAILSFVNRNLDDPRLSAAHVSQQLSVSERYVQLLFARSGTTFSEYVRCRRLDHIVRDLIDASVRHHPLTVIAYRWGFRSSSAFNKSFKARYGCSPREYRRRYG